MEPYPEDAGTSYTVAYSKVADASDSSSDIVIPANRKVIYRVTMSLDVASLTDVEHLLNLTVSEMGGWTEVSRESDSHAYLSLRVPLVRINEFIDIVSGTGEVMNKVVTTDDITSKYMDVERQKDLYEREYQAYADLYETLMKEASTPENTQNKLAVLKSMQEASAMIDSLNGTLSGYDKQVDFATFYIDLYETGTYEKPSYWTELGDVFSGSVGSVGTFFGILLKVTVAVTPYVLIFGAVAVVVLLICKKAGQKRRAGKAVKNGDDTQQ